MLFKKTLAVFMALVMVLGCNIITGAETVDDEALKLEEVVNEIVETLPEEFQDKDFLISEGEAENGEDRALVAVEDCMPQTVQSLIDDGSICSEDVDVPEGVTITLKEINAVVPFVEMENGEYVNALSDSGINSSWVHIKDWDEGVDNYSNDYYVTYGKLYSYYYDYNSYGMNGRAFRPMFYDVKYTATTSTTPTELIAKYAVSMATLAEYPEYLEGTGSILSEFEDYLVVCSKNYPSPNTIYSFSTAIGDRCIINTSDTQQAVLIDLYLNNNRVCQAVVYWG